MTDPNVDTDEEPELIGPDLAGEKAGEAELEPGTPFFVSKKAAAVLKHGILSRYIKPWAAKVGSTAEDKRVVYVDGYAGPGKYEDGTAGSPALILDTARDMPYRSIDCHFVEKTRKSFGPLSSVIADAQRDGVSCQAYRGRLDRHLDSILQAAGKAPLFVFLDPFGLAIPFEDITGKIMGGSRNRASGTKTEVLINFSSNAVRRIGAFLDKDGDVPNRESTLGSMDRACGGSWWRDIYTSLETNEQRVVAIADEFMTRAAKAANSGGWSLPVRNRADLQPVYHLVYLSRHPDGLWLFGDCLARAQEDWRRHLSPPPAPSEGTLFELDDTFPTEEQNRTSAWLAEIKGNIRQLLRDNPSGFPIQNQYAAVLGAAIGLAKEPLIRQAVKELHAAGETSCPGTGKVSKFFLSP